MRIIPVLTLTNKVLYILLVFIMLLFFHQRGYSNKRLEFPQYGLDAAMQSLGLAGSLYTSGSSAIYYLSSHLDNIKDQYVEISTGFSNYNRLASSVDYIQPIKNTGFTLGFGLELGGLMSSIASKAPMDTLFTSAMSYNFGKQGVIGVNFKVAFDNYNQFLPEGGLIAGISYSFYLMGFSFNAGLSNIGFNANKKQSGFLYPDLQLGLSYSYKSQNGENIFFVGALLENNIGSYIAESTKFSTALSIRVFSTGYMASKILINDPGLLNQDKSLSSIDTEQLSYTRVYLNLGVEFSANTHFSTGLSVEFNKYIFSLAILLPGEKYKEFSFYASLAIPV